MKLKIYELPTSEGKQILENFTFNRYFDNNDEVNDKLFVPDDCTAIILPQGLICFIFHRSNFDLNSTPLLFPTFHLQESIRYN